MSVAQEVTASQQITLHFFDYLFGAQKGFLCLATASPDKKDFKQHFFEWPEQKVLIVRFVEEQTKRKNVWFCVNLLMQPDRRKEYCLPSAFAWADLDYIIPTRNGDNNKIPYPTCVVESSPARFQAYWKIEGGLVPPDVAEDFSRKLAYALGADKSGWDLTQLLRIPFTNNFKYTPSVQVKLLDIENITYDASLFDRIQVAAVPSEEPGSVGLPENLPSLDSVTYKFRTEGRIDEEFMDLYGIEPPASADWSRILWRFIHKCFKMGMTPEETFVVATNAACNKYRRDGRPDSYLWRDVTKAAQEHERTAVLLSEKVEIVTMPHLVDFDEFEEDTFIKDYKVWANESTDAPEQYHELSCFIALSAIVSSGLYVATQYREVVPNIWGLVLGESTFTRKTTAMGLAVRMLESIDPELIVATDGSGEGLLTSLSHRPKRVSIYWKDEVSGLFESMRKKDYLAGLAETLTHLYDVPSIYNRVLRKETITITEPYFIFFGGGVRDKVYSIINEEWITSGFMPRFLIVAGENDDSRFRATGPPTTISSERKDNLITTLADLRDRYINFTESTIAGQTIHWPVRIEAKLTDDAWKYYQEIETTLMNAGRQSDVAAIAGPTFQRLSGSLLKMSLLVAASRRGAEENNTIVVEAKDVKQAAFYIERWGHYSIDLILNAGRSETEKIIDRALRLIRSKEGILRSELMQRMHLSARDAKDLIDTLVQRGLVDIKQQGKGQNLYSTGIGG